MQNKGNFDFLAIGDITTDAFIKLKDASVHCDINNENCTICMRFADKIPYERVDIVPAVGNSANAAVAASRLGIPSALLAWIGDDQNGCDCLASLERDRVDTSLIQTEEGLPTNYHYVLSYEAERTILVNHISYSYRLPENIGNPTWIYLSSIGGNSLEYHDEIANYLKEHSETKLVFQPGTFQMETGFERLQEIYKRTEIFFCNVEEAKKILKNTSRDIAELLKGIHTLGPRIVSITDGPKGSYIYDGTHAWSVPMYPDPKPPVERTGAGDAFASTFSVFYALGMSIEECLLRAPINSMSVVQKIGAQAGLLSRDEIEKYLAEKPEHYKVIQIF